MLSAEDDRREPLRMAPVGPEEPVHPRQSSRGIIAFCLGLGAWFSSCCCIGPFIRLVQVSSPQGDSARPQFGPEAVPEAMGAACADFCCAYGIPLILAISAMITGYEARRRQEARLGWARAGVLIGFGYVAFVVLLAVWLLISCVSAGAGPRAV